MSKVSQTTREGDIARKFRHLLDVTLKEFEIFKNVNKLGVTMDDFLKNIPLGVIYKNHVLEPGTDFNMLLDHFNCDHETRMAIFIELAPLDKFKEYMDGLYSGAIELDPEEQEDGEVSTSRYNEYIFQASIRGRDDIVEYLFGDNRIKYSMYETERYRYYPASRRLRDLFVKHEPVMISALDEEYGMRDPDEFGIINTDWDRMEPLLTTVWLCTCFQEQDMFIKYYIKYHNSVPDYLKKILEDKSLKYNTDKYHTKLHPIMDSLEG
jgi:hypothetical protein